MTQVKIPKKTKIDPPYWLCYIMASVVIVRGIITQITCLKFSLLSFSEIQRLFEDREICVFFRRLQRHNTTTSFFTTHTHSQTQTLTHTHMPGQPWLAGQVVPEEFFRVLQIIFDHMWSARVFFGRQGVTYIRKRFPDL